MSEFEIISGNNNIILVAPHGHVSEDYQDDECTAELTREIQKTLGCYAVINEVYRKPGKKEPTYDKKKKICNLNHIDHYEDKSLYEEFVGPIKRFKEEIAKRGESPYIFHIHGASTDKFDNACRQVYPDDSDSVNMLIGTGRGLPPYNKNESLTAQQDIVETFITALKNLQILAYSTTSKDYTAKAPFNPESTFQSSLS